MESTPDFTQMQIDDLKRRIIELEKILKELNRSRLRREMLNREDLDYFSQNMGGTMDDGG